MKTNNQRGLFTQLISLTRIHRAANSRRKRPFTARPRFESLENRAMMATFAQTLLPPSHPQENSLFGYATAADTSFHVVGAPWAAVNGVAGSGVAYVYNASTGALVVTLNNPTPGSPDQFGNSVAVSGNLVVVGAIWDAPGDVPPNSGSAYVFNATTGALVATLANPSADGPDLFGGSVAVSGNTVVVGAWQDDTDGVDSGRAYIFNATTGGLVATLVNPSPADFDFFGESVAVSGNSIVVGANGDDTGFTDSGQAYVFNATTGALVATLANPTPATGDLFGYSVAVSGNSIVVGAFLDDTAARDSGQAYVFNATTGALVATLANPTPATGDYSGDYFGNSVAVSGNTVVVGALNDDTAGENSGQAYVFNATTGALVATLANPTPATGDHFGYSVAVSGNSVVVGTPYKDDHGIRPWHISDCVDRSGVQSAHVEQLVSAG